MPPPAGLGAGRCYSTDPATGAVFWEGCTATPSDVAAAVARARAAQAGWAAEPLATRLACVRAYASLLAERRTALSELIGRETGKPRWEAEAEIGSMIVKVDSSIAAQAERAGERRDATRFGEAVLRHRPHGVAAVLGPFNFPGHLPNGHIVPALLAGNAVVFKPSEMTPAVGEAMVAAWHDAGVPADVLILVQGGRETGAALAAADIDALFFTGSAPAGAQLRRALVDRPGVIAALELGGNNPLIAWDGDVEEAASIAVQSAFITTGQRCSCARRLIVRDDRFGRDIVDAIVALVDRLRIGAWHDDPVPFMGPLISDAAADDGRARVAELIDRHASPIRPLGGIAGRPASFVTPAVIDVTGIDVPDEEIFAPVLQVIRVTDVDAAFAAANATRFGLAAGLVTEDDGLWDRFLATSRAGVVNRNRPTTGASGTMPFGGTGASGNHRPSAYYAADYCAYPVASFEAPGAMGNAAALAGMLQA